MGSPSTIFIIANINGRYRSLSAVFRSHGNHGEHAVEACRQIITILQAPENQSLIYYELKIAAGLPPETWDTATSFRDEKPFFPFLATCLMLGVSGNIKIDGHGYNATHMPFNTPLENCAASEGITVLDVTDPTAVKYAFLFLGRQSPWLTGKARATFSNVPLMAWEYLAFGDFEFKHSSEYRDLNEGAAGLKAEAVLTATLTGRSNADETLLPSPLIDEETLPNAWPPKAECIRRWRRRDELGLCALPPAPKNGPSATARLSGELKRHLEVFYSCFRQSYRMFAGNHELAARAEPYKPASPIKQVLHLLTLGPMSEWPWERRVGDYKPFETNSYRPGAVQYFRFPTDDAPSTPGVALEMLHACIQKGSNYLGKTSNYYQWATSSNSDLDQVKLLGLPGTGHAIKPLPGRAYYYAKAAYHCKNGDWMTVGLEDLTPGEWTVILVQHCEHEHVERRGSPARTSLKSLSFKCAFISRDRDGNITSASAKEFREIESSTIEMEAAVALDPGEQEYGRELVKILGRNDGTINGVSVTMMETDTVEELLRAMATVKASEDRWLEDSWSDEHWIIKTNRRKLAGTNT